MSRLACRPFNCGTSAEQPFFAGTIVILGRAAYLGGMFSSFDFCLPTRATVVPNGPEWFHEIKYDGYRLRVERNGDRVRWREIAKRGRAFTRRMASDAVDDALLLLKTGAAGQDRSAFLADGD